MIRFVDLHTGNVFDGVKPYIFWFDDEQSVNLIYTKPICFISHERFHNIEIEDNEIFHLLKDTTNLQTVILNGVDYYDLNQMKCSNIQSVGTPHHNYFVHMIYICASGKTPGEYICDCRIDDQTISIGADFYDANETLYVNLSNKGIEIPESIQKSLYSINIHEDKRDDITLNRKWKELLSNFIDIMSNKGSYKSLYNSLKWFEYGDLVKICELWSRKDCGEDRYLSKEMIQDLSNHYIDNINNLTKTTYISLSLALKKICEEGGVILYDDEKNPKLEDLCFDWSINDMALKMCMLGNFYKTYFMPIHLDLMYATIENTIFTNTIKTVLSKVLERNDFIYNVKDIQCNVDNGDIFRLDIVECYVNQNTIFGTQYDNQSDMDDMVITGVDKVIKKINASNQNSIKTFTSQMYHGIGSIINFEFNVDQKIFDVDGSQIKDFIKRSILVFNTYDKNGQKNCKTITYNKPIQFDKTFEFNLLCTKEGEYEIRVEFDMFSGDTYVKNIKFAVIDTNHVTLKVCKVLNIGDPELSHRNGNINNYEFNRYNDGNYKKYIQYIPSKFIDPHKTGYEWKGVCLNHMIVYEGAVLPNDYLVLHYHVFNRNIYYDSLTDTADTQANQSDPIKTYTYCISRRFGFDPNRDKMPNNSIYKESYIFVPDFHRLEEFDYERGNKPDEMKYYIITDKDTICLIPGITYGKYIEEYEYKFINVSELYNNEIIPPISIKEPFITQGVQQQLTPGYYNIIFRYRLTGEDQINEILLDSAFYKQ